MNARTMAEVHPIELTLGSHEKQDTRVFRFQDHQNMINFVDGLWDRVDEVGFDGNHWHVHILRRMP